MSVKIFPTTSLSSGTVKFPSPGARNALCQVLLNITCLGPSMTRMEPFLAPGTVCSPSEKKWSLFRRSVLLYLKVSNCRPKNFPTQSSKFKCSTRSRLIEAHFRTGIHCIYIPSRKSNIKMLTIQAYRSLFSALFSAKVLHRKLSGHCF